MSHLRRPTQRRKLKGMQDGIARNQAFLDAVVEFQDTCSPFPLRDGDERAPGGASKTTAAQIAKINTTLRQCMRDWSVEGQDERRKSYGAVIKELERLCPVNPERKGAPKVLVPGAGEGRLTYEIVSRGYGCAGASFALLSMPSMLRQLSGNLRCYIRSFVLWSGTQQPSWGKVVTSYSERGIKPWRSSS